MNKIYVITYSTSFREIPLHRVGYKTYQEAVEAAAKMKTKNSYVTFFIDEVEMA